jgi:hypothetical protein
MAKLAAARPRRHQGITLIPHPDLSMPRRAVSGADAGVVAPDRLSNRRRTPRLSRLGSSRRQTRMTDFLSAGGAVRFSPTETTAASCSQGFSARSRRRRFRRTVSGGVARCRGASRVPVMYPRCTRVLLTRATLDVYLQTILSKPSDGLEPSTPSLPSSDAAGSEGKRGSRPTRNSRKSEESDEKE